MLTLDVHAASEAERRAVIGVITLACACDPMARWAFPDPAAYLSALPDLADALGGSAFDHGTAHLIGGGRAAAMWLPPTADPDTERLEELAEQHARKDRLDDLMRIFEQMDAFHPTEPCWYLPFIGVDPIHQGQGYGSALLRHTLWRCDREGLPAYLQSSSARTISLYERHGFEIIGAIQEGTSPTLVPMLRRPRH